MRSPNRCLMATPGEALRIGCKDLQRIMVETPGVRCHLLNYVHALLIQNTQTALCNVRHQLEERLCRWLLLAADRLDGNVIPLTHDQLSMILGVRRAGVTTALAKLYEDGAVIKTRGTVEIVDRAVLERNLPVLSHHLVRIQTNDRGGLPALHHRENPAGFRSAGPCGLASFPQQRFLACVPCEQRAIAFGAPAGHDRTAYVAAPPPSQLGSAKTRNSTTPRPCDCWLRDPRGAMSLTSVRS